MGGLAHLADLKAATNRRTRATARDVMSAIEDQSGYTQEAIDRLFYGNTNVQPTRITAFDMLRLARDNTARHRTSPAVRLAYARSRSARQPQLAASRSSSYGATSDTDRTVQSTYSRAHADEAIYSAQALSATPARARLQADTGLHDDQRAQFGTRSP